MKIAGKCPPEKDELEAAAERGFEQVELYLEKQHLEELEESISNVRSSPVDAISVHTPHVTLEEKDYFLKADRLASELDAFLVFHSQYLHHVHITQLEEMKIGSEYGYENNPGASPRILESTILDQGHRLVLDTAHFYMSEKDYLGEMSRFLDEYSSQMPLIHLCDSTRTEDGLDFGEGDMDMEKLCKIIDDSGFDGILVLEVMPEDQGHALEKWNEYTG